MLQSGSRFGDYTVVRPLGKGGMGEVWLVTHRKTGELRALKLLSGEGGERTPEFIRRFIREGEFARAIRHPNLVAVYEVGRDAVSGRHYIVMEYVSGGSVREAIDQHGRFDIGEAVSVIREVSYGLAAAHQHGVIHRDIKPDNIMFAADGTPKLADLGIARFTGDRNMSTMTSDGSIIGTPAYMSPEQMMNAHEVDARADIYSLGIVFYEMLTGERPNDKDTVVQLMAKAVKGVPIPDVRKLRPEVSASLVQVLNVMCARRPDDRFDSMQTMVDVFERLRREGFDTRLGLRTPRGPHHRLWQMCLASVSVVALAAGVLAYDRLGVFTDRYSDWVDCFGVPKGLGRLSREAASHRTGHWRFSYRGRHGLFGERVLRETAFVNAFGIPIVSSKTKHGISLARSSYHFSEDGALAFVDRYSPWGLRERRDIYSGQGNAYVDFKYPLADGGLLSIPCEGHNVGCYFKIAELGTEGISVKKSEIRRVRMTRDSNGFVVKEEFLANDMNVPAWNESGEHVRIYERDPDGRVLGVCGQDDNARLVPFDKGVAMKRFVLNSEGVVVCERNLDINGRLTMCSDGWMERRFTRDEYGRCLREAYYDEKGVLMHCEGGYAIYDQQFNDSGQCVAENYLDAQGKLAVGRGGFARKLMRYDNNGFLAEERIEDDAGRSVPTQFGVFVSCYEYDERGLQRRRWYLDDRGRRCRGHSLAAERQMSYLPNGLLSEISYYDESGRPCTEFGEPWPQMPDKCRERNEYDENWRRIGIWSLGGDGKPCKDQFGQCEMRLTYDAFGNVKRIRFFGPSGTPDTLLALGGHELACAFDEGGRVSSVRFLDVNGKPCGYALGQVQGSAKSGGGVQRIDYRYDLRGNLVTISYLDSEGRPMADANGRYCIRCSYDSRGQEMEVRMTDDKGRLVEDRTSGRAMYRWSRDSYGRITGLDGFDANGTPVPDKWSTALFPLGVFSRCSYDNKGRKRRSWHVDVDGRKIEGSEQVSLYDANGRKRGACYVDSSGNPTNGPRGYAWSLLDKDHAGRMRHLLYYRADFTPHLLPKECWGGGFAGFDCRYYPDGSDMWKLHLGADGGPVRVNGGRCGHARAYDAGGKTVMELNLDVDGSAFVDKDGNFGWRIVKGKRQWMKERPEVPKAIADSLRAYFADATDASGAVDRETAMSWLLE